MHVVKFNPINKITEDVVPAPKPAKNYIPEWYKNLGAFKTKHPEFDDIDGVVNSTVKLCVPFRDAMTAGYIQESWQDIRIEFDNNDKLLHYSFPTQPAIVGLRDEVSLPIDPDLFHLGEFFFSPVWAPELPKGWSMLFTSPLNHFDLPFWMPSGIMDSDSFTHFNSVESRLPFYIKKTFSGVIPKGTPLFQMIPIKRSKWISKTNKWNQKIQDQINHRIRSVFWSGYKKEFWTKKEYL